MLWVESITRAMLSGRSQAGIQPSLICFSLKGLDVMISRDRLTGAGLGRDFHKAIAIRLARMKLFSYPTFDLSRRPE